MQSAIGMYDSLRASNDASFDFSEPELNSLGYELPYGDRKVNDAIQVFKMNTTRYPASSNAFDSLGEAYAKSDNKGLAVKNYSKAVELNPANLHARNMLKSLK